MAFKLLLAVCALVTLASAVPPYPVGGNGGGVNPWIPPWLAAAPWYPQWTPCTAVGPTCLDCTTKLICTKIGGIQRACTDPTMPYCNLGECSATPVAGCGDSAV